MTDEAGRLLNVQLAATDGHSGSQLQVIGVVGVDFSWLPWELSEKVLVIWIDLGCFMVISMYW